MPTLSDLTDPGAVAAALREFDALGRTRFLSKYGFKPSRRYFLLHDGRHYDSKAIVGAAIGYQHGTPLQWTDFSGGMDTVVPKLHSLGFSIVALEVTEESSALPEEIPEPFTEGRGRTVTVNRFERSARARAACIAEHGTDCAVCGLDFASVYGDEFQGLVHVHHLRPLATIGAAYRVDPLTDLIPVCPNCHAAIHYGGVTRDVDAIRASIRAATRARRRRER